MTRGLETWASERRTVPPVHRICHVERLLFFVLVLMPAFDAAGEARTGSFVLVLMPAFDAAGEARTGSRCRRADLPEPEGGATTGENRGCQHLGHREELDAT